MDIRTGGTLMGEQRKTEKAMSQRESDHGGNCVVGNVSGQRFKVRITTD